jgi:hypothetical protein
VIDPHWDSVVSYLRLNSDFTDETSRHDWTVGTAAIDNTTHKFGGGSCRSTSGNYKEAASSSDWAFGVDKFTVELWARSDFLPTSTWFSPFGNWASNVGWCFFFRTGARIRFAVNGTGVETEANLVTANTWHRLAYSRVDGDVGCLYVDDILRAVHTNTENLTSTSAPLLGKNRTAADTFVGNEDEVRVTLGVGRYGNTANLPVTAFADDVAGDPDFANVVLLAHMDGSDGSTTFIDSSTSAKTITANGNAQIDTDQSVFGGASGLFDGVGDYLSLATSADFNFGTGAFIIQGRFRRSSDTNVLSTIIGSNKSTYAAGATAIRVYGSGAGASSHKLALVDNAAGGIILESTTATSLSTWYYFAVMRLGNTFYLQINDKIEATAEYTGVIDFSDSGTLIGSEGWSPGTQFFQGHLDEIRATKGLDRDVPRLDPQTLEFPLGGIGSITPPSIRLGSIIPTSIFNKESGQWPPP